MVGVAFDFFGLLYSPLSGRRPDIDCNFVSKGHLTQNNQPTSISVCVSCPSGFENWIWDLIVLVPDHCLSFYFPVVPLRR